MAWYGKTKTGKDIVLLNPSEKAGRYAHQLRTGYVAETGEVLSATHRAHNVGYLKARSDNAKAYCANKGIKSKAKPYYGKKKSSRSNSGGVYLLPY